MQVLISGAEGGMVCPCVPTLFDDGIFSEGGFE